MELSKDQLKGLSRLQNANIINDETFGKLLETVVSELRDKPDSKHAARMYGSKPDIVKGVYADLLSLFVEAARHDLDGEMLGTFLSGADITGPRARKLCEAYAKNKSEVRASLGGVGESLPHVVDATWRLDHCVKSNTESNVAGPLYDVRLSTKQHGKVDYLVFTCTTGQLQELVYKLKDAVRHAERTGNV